MNFYGTWEEGRGNVKFIKMMMKHKIVLNGFSASYLHMTFINKKIITKLFIFTW